MAASVQALQQQIHDLQATIAEERERHRNESSAVAQRIKKLEERLTTNVASGHGAKRPVVPTTTATRSVIAKTSSSVRLVEASRVAIARKAASTRGPTKPGPVEAAATAAADDQPTAGANNVAKRPASASPARDATTVPGSSDIKTAPQHAWDKFCVLARNEFTVKELSLVSLDTLRSLIEHYHITSPVEVAQIECQWALFQEGKKAAENATPHRDARRPRNGPFEPVAVDSGFDVPVVDRKPHLSRRHLLCAEPVRSGNPNTSVERHRTPSPSSKGSVFVDKPAYADPNTLRPRSPDPNAGKRAVSGPEDQLHRLKYKAGGKDRSHSPLPTPAGPHPIEQRADRHQGVKYFSRNNKNGDSPEHQHRGLKMLKPLGTQCDAEVILRGKKMPATHNTTTSQIVLA